MVQLHGAIIRPLPKNRSISDFCTIGIPKVYLNKSHNYPLKTNCSCIRPS